MTDATIGVDAADGEADASGARRNDGAVASVWVPEEDGWTEYRLTPDSRLTVDGADGKPRAIIETDPDLNVD